MLSEQASFTPLIKHQTLYIKQFTCLDSPHQIQGMDNISKMLTVLCVLIMCFMVGGLAEHWGDLSGGVNALANIISKDTFNNMLKHRNDGACAAKGFYTYEAFIEAAKSFPAFASTGDDATRKREVAAFLGQTSHETTGGWPTAPDGPYAWGYCFKQEKNPTGDFCQPSNQYPCAPGKRYYGRGPIQLTWNFNYGPSGRAIGVDLLKNPDLVATNPVISFKTALWFWMTPQRPKPSCHDVITGRWQPSPADRAAGRLPGYGTITNIINGGLECGRGQDARVADRIGFYKRYCDILRVGYGANLDCYSQKPFGSSSLIELVSSMMI